MRREKFSAMQLSIYTENMRQKRPRKCHPEDTLVLFVLISEIKIDLNDKGKLEIFEKANRLVDWLNP